MNVYTLPRLLSICTNQICLINFLLVNGMIKRDRRHNCRRRMTITRNMSMPDGHFFGCPKCRSFQSIRKGSFFEHSNLTIPQILLITLCWAMKVPVKSTVYIANVCEIRSASGSSFYVRNVANDCWKPPITFSEGRRRRSDRRKSRRETQVQHGQSSGSTMDIRSIWHYDKARPCAVSRLSACRHINQDNSEIFTISKSAIGILLGHEKCSSTCTVKMHNEWYSQWASR